MEPHPHPRGDLLQVRVIGHHHHDLRPQVAGPLAPEQLQQGVLGAGDEDGQALDLRGVRQAPAHAERLRHGPELPLQGRHPGPQVREGELDAHEEGPRAVAGVGGVLVRGTMFAPRWYRKRDTAATIPGRSGQSTIRRPRSLLGRSGMSPFCGAPPAPGLPLSSVSWTGATPRQPHHNRPATGSPGATIRGRRYRESEEERDVGRGHPWRAGRRWQRGALGARRRGTQGPAHRGPG